MFDDTTYEPHRLMYWPSTSANAEYVFQYQDEPWLDPDTVLARYPLERPLTAGVRQQRKRRNKETHEKPE